MNAPLVLSLFPGIGLLDMAFEEAGFCVVRGPDLLWGGDVRRFHPPAGRFDGVIGGPPCQTFSTMKHLTGRGGQKHGNQIPEYERVVGEADPTWFLMENVEGAPEPAVDGFVVRSTVIADHWCGGVTARRRRFSFGTQDGARLAIDTLALHRPDPERAALAAGGFRPGRKVLSNGRVVNGTEGWKTAADLENHIRLQGLPAGFLSDAPFTVEGKIRVVGNGVPLAMGRAVAAAVCRAIGFEPGREVAA